MLETIGNKRMYVSVTNQGAELRSVSLDGVERLWQGDPLVWDGRSPVLFPIVGRVKEGKYTYNGQEYAIACPHGFARSSAFSVVERSKTSVTYRLKANEETKAQYPFDFVLDVTYRVCDTALSMSFTVRNEGEGEMYYSFGGHPGFFVPTSETLSYSDWFLQFSEEKPLMQAMLDGMFMSRRVEECPFADGNRIPLSHKLFDDDAIILADLKNKTVVLKNSKNSQSIRCDFDGFDFIAFWKAAGTEANYICFEPWNGLPSDAQDPEDLKIKRDLRILPAGGSETRTVTFTFED